MIQDHCEKIDKATRFRCYESQYDLVIMHKRLDLFRKNMRKSHNAVLTLCEEKHKMKMRVLARV